MRGRRLKEEKWESFDLGEEKRMNYQTARTVNTVPGKRVFRTCTGGAGWGAEGGWWGRTGQCSLVPVQEGRLKGDSVKLFRTSDNIQDFQQLLKPRVNSKGRLKNVLLWLKSWENVAAKGSALSDFHLVPEEPVCE